MRSKSIFAPRPGPSGGLTIPSRSATDPERGRTSACVRQQHFEILRVRDGEDHVQVRDVVERVAAVMNLEVHVERFGEMSDLDERA